MARVRARSLSSCAQQLNFIPASAPPLLSRPQNVSHFSACRSYAGYIKFSFACGVTAVC